MTADLIRRLQAAAAEHGTLDGAPADRSLLLHEAADALEAASKVVGAVPSVEHLEALASWLDLVDLFASKVDPTYTLPRDEVQQDLRRLVDAVKEARS